MTLPAIISSLVVALSLSGPSPVDYVNCFLGTGGMGHTFPGATVPFGGVQLSPDTDTIPHNVNGQYQKRAYEYCAGYRYSDKTIVGFSHTHLSGTGHSDLGDILIMPGTGQVRLNPGTADNPDSGYRSRFDHGTEKASPGYYEVVLSDDDIKVQLTATERTGVHKITFPEGEDAHLVIDLVHGIYNYDGKVLRACIRVENDSLLTGYRITEGWAKTNYSYFAISFSRHVIEYGYEEKELPLYRGFWRKFKTDRNFPEMIGRKIVSWFRFGELDRPLTVKVALSATGTDGALRNLEAESLGKSFEEIASEARGKWNRSLGILEVEGTEDQKTMFYTSLYHTMINPSVYMDVDGSYRGIDHNIHKAEGFTNYTVFSLWDTYRALHPFLNLVAPSRNRDMIASMVAHQKQSVHGMLPVWSLMGNEGWCMSGYHSAATVADAIVKGVYDDAAGEGLKAMVSTSNVPYFDGIEDYLKLGYVPFEKSSTAASTTLEYSFDDWAIACAAEFEGDSEIATEYYKRGKNYRNVFDTSIGFARPRYSDGSFKKDFDPLQTYGEGFIEGNSWNFSFHAPQDVNGLIGLMGGDKAFIKRLDDLFTMDLPEIYYKDNEDITKECLLGGYVHGNEPSHHVPYLYAWTSQPWKGQSLLRKIMTSMYRNSMDGLSGNDDCGQMSAWYIFSAMGFYPVAPGSDQYVFGAPYLPHILLHLESGNNLEIKAEGLSDKNCYVKSVTLNGKKLERLYITHAELMEGGVLEFEMSSKPSKKRGLRPEEKPYSLTSISR